MESNVTPTGVLPAGGTVPEIGATLSHGRSAGLEQGPPAWNPTQPSWVVPGVPSAPTRVELPVETSTARSSAWKVALLKAAMYMVAEAES